MDLGTPPRTQNPKVNVMEYNPPKQLKNGTLIERVTGLVSVEEKANRVGLEALDSREKRNLAIVRAERIKKQKLLGEKIDEGFVKNANVLKKPHELSKAARKAFGDSPNEVINLTKGLIFKLIFLI